MNLRKLRLSSFVVTCTFMAANIGWAIGFQLSQTKEQLGLKYDVAAMDHGTGRMTVTLTLVDEGKLKPLNSVDLVVASKDGKGFVDLSVPIALRMVDGKQMAYVHLQKEWAERTEIQLKSSSLDGKSDGLTWYYHSIPLAKYIKREEPKHD